eukprot:4481379-Pyramimonas_sp.AAC.1
MNHLLRPPYSQSASRSRRRVGVRSGAAHNARKHWLQNGCDADLSLPHHSVAAPLPSHGRRASGSTPRDSRSTLQVCRQVLELVLTCCLSSWNSACLEASAS